MPLALGIPFGGEPALVIEDSTPQLGLNDILSPAEAGIPLQFHPSGSLSRWDERKIFNALADPDNLRQVLEEGTVPFDISDLDVGMTKAESVVVQLAKDYMRYLEFSIRYYIFAETQSSDARQRMKNYIETIKRSPAYDIKGLNRYREYFAVIPQRAKLINLTVSYLSKLFDGEVLEYIRSYFYAAAQVDSDTALKLRKVLQTLEAEYDFLPKEYYSKVEDAIDEAISAGEKDKKYD
ncbi:hypothetical protein DSO57_1004953 [Entomophthora muscae]|uniref:Uncharacterized protein n=1 Tax=Entomophthora muscae TaxID=34485 RepID=A0ACC2T846_9FUNG|nr:hypothetical protein DSO57_1004953 [Entomophthora muscae]